MPISVYQLPLFILDKRCNDCGEVKPRETFYRNRTRPDGLQLRCIECHKKRQKARYASVPELFAQRNAAYYAAHRDELLEYSRQWRLDNPERYAERHAKYRDSNREILRSKWRAYAREHKERKKQNWLAWCKRNRERARAMAKRWRETDYGRESGRLAAKSRRYRLRGVVGKFSLDEWRDLCERCGNACLCCGSIGPLTADHIVPISRGGSGFIDNIQPLCRSCNSAKGTKTTDYRPVATGGAA